MYATVLLMTSTERARVSRRERPAKPALTREGIVTQAVEVMRAEGLERVTMRRLAQELDTGAASLYVYVRNIADLYSAMLEELLDAVDLGPVTAEGDWGDRLAQVLTSYGLVLLEYPSLARAMLVSRPSGPRFLVMVEGLLALLDEGKVPGDRAAWAVDLLLQFATATAAEQGIRAESLDAQDEQDTLAAVLGEVPPHTHPHLAALGTELLSGPGEARLAWGFRVLLNGALSTPRPGPSGT
jgi:AcrR family transcriptional regulator